MASKGTVGPQQTDHNVKFPSLEGKAARRDPTHHSIVTNLLH